MKTRRLGSSRPWCCFHRVRRRAMSARSCSLACRLFFERDPGTPEEPPHRPVTRRRAALGQLGDTARNVRSGFSAMRASSHSRSPSSESGRRPPICCAAALPVACQRWHHFTTLATLDPKQRRRLPGANAPPPPSDHTIPKVRRIGSCHRCWPPTPASILNHKTQCAGMACAELAKPNRPWATGGRGVPVAPINDGTQRSNAGLAPNAAPQHPSARVSECILLLLPHVIISA